MGGFLKGALLGLASAAALIVVVAVFAPDADPAKYSEAPDVSQEDAPKITPPDVPQDTTAAGVETPVEPQNVPQTPEVEEAPVDPDVATTTPAIVTNPALPKTIETPDVSTDSNVAVIAEPMVDLGEEASEQPAAEPEAQTIEAPQKPAPVEAQQSQPVPPASDTLGQPAESLAVVPLETQPKPENQPEPERAQSSAEAEDGPPSVLSESPQPPRAVERPVVSEEFGAKVGNFIDQENQLVNRAPSVRVNQLPNMSQDEAQPVEQVDVAQAGALRDNRASFQATGKPLIGILLIEGNDRSEDADRLALIADFGVPLSIAIDPMSEGAYERAANYYASGADIVVLATVPEGASPQDVEVTFAEYQTQLPMAVAMMETPAVRGQVSATQLNRGLLEHVVAILRDRGYGLVAENKGLNTAIQLANKTGVPHVQIFYRITPEETQDRLRTIFNRAVFRATQKGASVVTAPGDVTALTALKAWALVDRPASVQMAPISAVLLGVAPQ